LIPKGATSTYLVRILFGPLCGLELPLDAGRYFFVTANMGDETHPLGESVLKNVDQTFWVPGGFTMADDRSPSSSEWQTVLPNFAIELGEHTRIEIVSATGLRSEDIAPCSLFESDGIRLAFRRGDQSWPDRLAHALGAADVDQAMPPHGNPEQDIGPLPPNANRVRDASRQGNAHPEAAMSRVHASGSDDPAELAVFPAKPPARPASRQKWRSIAAVSAIAGFAAAGLHASSLVGPTRTNIVTSALTLQLQGSPNPPAVHHGRDGKVYVLAATVRDAAWVRQALYKAGGNDQVRVRVTGDEVERLESVLKQRSVQFFKLRMDSPAQPTLVLNSDHHPDNDRWTHALRQAVLDAIPYADDLKFERHSLALIDAKARDGLDAMQIPYRSVRQGSRTTYQIARTLDDAELNALDQFTRRFSHDWGTHQIRFKFNTDTEPPSGESYRYGSSHYVSAGRDSVRFVKPVL
jgi:hypothetical protein